MIHNSSRDITADDLVSEILKLRDDTRTKMRKEEIVALLRKMIKKIGKTTDARVLFEELEPALSKPLLVGNWLVKYSFTSELLFAEPVPTWDNAKWMAEIRNDNLAEELKKRIYSISWQEHVNFIRNIFEKVPWIRDFRIMKATRDNGVDFEAKYVSDSIPETPLIGQAKHWKNKVGAPEIRDFLGTLQTQSKGETLFGMFVSTRGFSYDAMAYLGKTPFRLFTFDVNTLVKLMIANKIGVRDVMVRGLDFDTSFWDELE